jgi:hypothetical protein
MQQHFIKTHGGIQSRISTQETTFKGKKKALTSINKTNYNIDLVLG